MKHLLSLAVLGAMALGFTACTCSKEGAKRTFGGPNVEPGSPVVGGTHPTNKAEPTKVPQPKVAPGQPETHEVPPGS